VKAYRQSEVPVADLLDTFYNLFDRKADVMGSILLETADLIDNAEKREEILSAWLDFKVEVRSARPPSVSQPSLGKRLPLTCASCAVHEWPTINANASRRLKV
jgi:hypothetical protein